MADKFKYGDAAIALNDAAKAKGYSELMRSEVLEMAGINGNRFYTVVDSALYHATCSEPESKATRTGRGSAMYYKVYELVNLFFKLIDPRAQARLLTDCDDLSEEKFKAKYNGKSKRDIFDGHHPFIATDTECYRYAPKIEVE